MGLLNLLQHLPLLIRQAHAFRQLLSPLDEQSRQPAQDLDTP